MPRELTSQQNKYLRGLAHRLKPIVWIGKNGLTTEVVASVDRALEKHELIKVKFVDQKEKAHKDHLIASICRQTKCVKAGAIGHTAILYREAREASRRKIQLPTAPLIPRA
ncbi:MAG: ribosome assembly RNA-binding protein YhbY [Desulfobacterales bacterium]|jgi:RNA-binding protein